MPKLFVAFACDAEDNHPNYVPGWEVYGSDYDKNPANVNWSWSPYWSDLSDCFNRRGVPVSWLIRVDNGPVMDQMLTLFKDKILALKALGDEIGIHIHPFVWKEALSKWVQTINPKDEVEIVQKSLAAFKRHMGFAPSSVRMGWTAMSNAIMQTLDSNGLTVDASAVPGESSSGKFRGRDNIYDWSRCPTFPYYPSAEDYQSSGNLKIVEMPISTLQSNVPNLFGSLMNKLSSYRFLVKLIPLARTLSLAPHAHFYLTPWWSPCVYGKIIKAYARKATEEGVVFLVGSFHTCDILNPATGKKNTTYEKFISDVMEQILSLRNISVEFLKLSELTKKFKKIPVKPGSG